MKARLARAFWSLLEERDLHDITVGDIVDCAGCNRGSFYYYYDSREDFLETIVRDDFLRGCGIQDFMLDVVSGRDPKIVQPEKTDNYRKLLLLIRHGGLGIVAREVRRKSFDMWSAVLHPEGGSLRAETAEIIEFMVGGVVGVLSHLDAEAGGSLKNGLKEYLTTVMKAGIESIARIEGTVQTEIVSRLKLLGQYSRMTKDTAAQASLQGA